MRNWRPTSLFAAMAIALLGAGWGWVASFAEPPAGAPPTTRVLMLGSLTFSTNGAYARNMRDWMNRFAALMQKQQVPLENITVLAEKADPTAKPPVTVSSNVNIQAAFAKLAKELRPQDQFVLFMVGLGSVCEPVGKLALPGPDLTGLELNKMLADLPTTNIVIINCASGGCELLENIAAPGRVIVSAAGGKGQGSETVYAEFFLLAYETGKADTNKDGKISVLEAFNWAGGECLDWYRRQLPGVIIKGKESCRIFKKLYEGTRLQLAGESDPNVPDGPPVFEPIKRKAYLFFSNPQNRVPSEGASLEDKGDATEAVFVETGGYRVLPEGKPGEEGELAARTFLGRPPPPR